MSPRRSIGAAIAAGGAPVRAEAVAAEAILHAEFDPRELQRRCPALLVRAR